MGRRVRSEKEISDMGTPLHLIFLVLAFVLFVLAGLGVGTPPIPPPARWNLGWLGLAFLTLALWLH